MLEKYYFVAPNRRWTWWLGAELGLTLSRGNQVSPSSFRKKKEEKLKFSFICTNFEFSFFFNLCRIIFIYFFYWDWARNSKPPPPPFSKQKPLMPESWFLLRKLIFLNWFFEGVQTVFKNLKKNLRKPKFNYFWDLLTGFSLFDNPRCLFS